MHTNSIPVDLSHLRKPVVGAGNRVRCPDEYIALLETKRYSINTARSYISLFTEFLNYFPNKPIIDINELDINTYTHHVVRQGKSVSYQNQAINAIKFYFEQVLDMPQGFYKITPSGTKTAGVLSCEEILKLISVTENLKHKAIPTTIYSCGLRLSELLALKISDIQSDRNLLLVRNAKGQKRQKYNPWKQDDRSLAKVFRSI